MSLDETKLFEIVPVDAFITKAAHYDFEKFVNPYGTLVVSTSAVNVANQGLPDYFFDVSFLGGTYVECDPDKSVLRKMHSDVITALQAWTPDLVTMAFGLFAPSRCCGVINIGSTFANDKAKNAFRADVRLVMTDVDLSSENFAPSAHLSAPYLVDEMIDEGTGTKTAYLCYSASDIVPITRVVTTGTLYHKQIEIMYAYGSWADRATLEYSRN